MALSPSVAERMVAHLFDESVPTQFDDALVVGADTATLTAAMSRWAEQGTARSVPATTVVSQTAAEIDESAVTATRATDFLGRTPMFEDGFEYVLCVPPDRTWDELSPEHQQSIAETSGHVDTQTAPPSLDILYLEKALLTLAADGIGVFLLDETLTYDETMAPYRGQFSGQALDAAPVEADPDRMLVTVVGDEPQAFDGAPLSLQATPSKIEQSLASQAGRETAGHSVADIMTPVEQMDAYAGDDDAPAVYLDLLSEDYDAALVYDDLDGRTDLLGYVARESMRPDTHEPVRTVTNPADAAPWIPATADLGVTIDQLGQSRFAFVGSVDSVAGIVTRFDLNSVPVYQYLYDQFAQLELGLRRHIRQQIDDWQSYSDSYTRYPTQDDLVVDELSQQQLGTLIEIAECAGLYTDFGIEGESQTTELDDLRVLRNAVAHYNPLVHTMTDEPTATERRRGANQFSTEHALLQTVLENL